MAAITAFNPPSDCLADTYLYSDSQLGANVFLGPMTSTCYPPDWTNTSTTHYSPAIVCPTSYSNLCQTTNVAGSVTETVITCCPTGFVCATPSPQWKNILGCTSSVTQKAPLTVVETDFLSSTAMQTQTAPNAVNAYGIQIRYQLTDLPNPTSTGSSTSSVSTTGPTPTPTGSSGLSGGAKAGIGIGVALASLICLIALVLGGRHVLRKRQSALSAAVNKRAVSSDDMELKSNGLYEAGGEVMYTGPYESGGHMTSELPERNERRVPELSGER